MVASRARFVLAVVLATWSFATAAATRPSPGFGPTKKPHPATVALRNYTATVRTNLGEFTLNLEPDAAPNTVRTFIKLGQRGAYDGLRICCAFRDKMLVAGEASATEKDKSPETLDAEDSTLSAVAGAVAMDRSADGRSCPGRLLILAADQNHLDGDYTVFANVDKGLDVVKRLASVATRPSNGSPAPVEDIVIEQVIVTRTPAPGAKETSDK